MIATTTLAHDDVQEYRWRFEEKFARRGPDDCWPWFLPGKTGYGSFRYEGRTVRSNRLAYAMYVEDVPLFMPDGQHAFVLHRCDNRPCVNPKHLFLGSHQDNMTDRNQKGRKDFGSKLPPILEDVVKALRADPRPNGELAKAYGMSYSTVYHIRARLRRAEVPD